MTIQSVSSVSQCVCYDNCYVHIVMNNGCAIKDVKSKLCMLSLWVFINVVLVFLTITLVNLSIG